MSAEMVPLEDAIRRCNTAFVMGIVVGLGTASGLIAWLLWLL